MNSLHNRSYEKELLDATGIPFDDIRQNMKELDTVNRLLGGHAISISGLKKLIGAWPKDRLLTICEIGCGGGDNLHALAEYCRKNKIHANFTGIDIKPACIQFAKEQYPTMQASWITSDYSAVDFSDNKPSIIFSSLFCHHFDEPQLELMLRWMQRNCALGFFINDLHRHPLAYHSIRLLTSVFSNSYLVKHDAPLSVARGFTKKEWLVLLDKAALKNYTVRWKWAFRHLVVCKHEQG